jgi:predicted HNH restriction endonuclease
MEWDMEDIDIHHLSYNNLGNERYRDLQILCRNCHQVTHAIKGSSQ